MRRCPQALYTAAGALRGAGWPARIDPEPRDSHVRGSAARTSERVCSGSAPGEAQLRAAARNLPNFSISSDCYHHQHLQAVAAALANIAMACTDERVTVVTVTIITMDRSGLYNGLIIKCVVLCTISKVKVIQNADAGAEVHTGEEVSLQAESTLLGIKNKLSGIHCSEMRSVSAHVKVLCQEAQDPERLACIYHGWSPWL